MVGGKGKGDLCHHRRVNFQYESWLGLTQKVQLILGLQEGGLKLDPCTA